MHTRGLCSSFIVLILVAVAGCSDGTALPQPPAEVRTGTESSELNPAISFGSFVADACTVGQRLIDATCKHTFVDARASQGRAWSANMWAPEGVVHVRQFASTLPEGLYVKACLCPAGAGDLYTPESCSQPLIAVDGYTDAHGDFRTNLPYSVPNATGQVTDPVHGMQVSGWTALATIDVAGTPTLVECHHGATCGSPRRSQM